MWRTVITWFFFVCLFFCIYIKENLQSSVNSHDLVFPIPVWQTVPGMFFLHTQNINYYLYDSPVQPASRSHPRGNIKKMSAKGR